MRVLGDQVACTQCNEVKTWKPGVFKTEKGRCRQPCIECDTRRRQANADANRERERAAGRERMARWRKANPDKVKEHNAKPRSFDRDLARERINRWRREHPERRQSEIEARRARRRSLPDTFTADDWSACLAYWNNCCAVCGRPPGDGFVLAQDHWIPLSADTADNPGHVPWNIVPLCHARAGARGGCNNSKGTRMPSEWLHDEEVAAAIADYSNAVTPPAAELIARALVESLS